MHRDDGKQRETRLCHRRQQRRNKLEAALKPEGRRTTRRQRMESAFSKSVGDRVDRAAPQ